jgi:hypothetical protein
MQHEVCQQRQRTRRRTELPRFLAEGELRGSEQAHAQNGCRHAVAAISRAHRPRISQARSSVMNAGWCVRRSDWVRLDVGADVCRQCVQIAKILALARRNVLDRSSPPALLGVGFAPEADDEEMLPPAVLLHSGSMPEIRLRIVYGRSGLDAG